MLQNTNCPLCETEGCRVRPVFLQATRWEGVEFLGFQGFCPECRMAFPVEEEVAV